MAIFSRDFPLEWGLAPFSLQCISIIFTGKNKKLRHKANHGQFSLPGRAVFDKFCHTNDWLVVQNRTLARCGIDYREHVDGAGCVDCLVDCVAGEEAVSLNYDFNDFLMDYDSMKS